MIRPDNLNNLNRVTFQMTAFNGDRRDDLTFLDRNNFPQEGELPIIKIEDGRFCWNLHFLVNDSFSDLVQQLVSYQSRQTKDKQFYTGLFTETEVSAGLK